MESFCNLFKSLIIFKSLESLEIFYFEVLNLKNFKLNINLFFHFNSGDFAQKDEIHLKAPTDQSMFERIKGSLNDFLSRQMMLQVFISFTLLENFVSWIFPMFPNLNSCELTVFFFSFPNRIC